jgi:thioester reductase-like protein
MTATTATDGYRERLVEALHTIERLQRKIEERPGADEPIAVVSVGCRLPETSDTPDELWEMLRAGTNVCAEFPAGRADAKPFYDADPDTPGKAYVVNGGFLGGPVDRFEPAAFGISPREALGMDPQQRLVLEVVWEALERAGYAPASLSGSRTGVFIGVSTTDYVRMRQQIGDIRDVDAYQIVGEPSFAAGRVSYTLGLRGPAKVVDTTCSSSLVTVHDACAALRSRECDLALAGGVNLMLTPYGFVLLSKFSALAADGRCKTFDASADGYARGEGAGVVVLKRLSDATRDKDTVLAVIRGSAVNHDGRSSGLTVPSPEAQQDIIRAALAQAKADPGEVDYVEAHGTGTSLGDPIELRALEAVLGSAGSRDGDLLVGSIKTNIGHLESAAGIAGLIKLVLSLHHREIPPHVNFAKPNPNIDWDALHIEVPTRGVPWPRRGHTPTGAVSSFGASGTNAHAVLSAAPERDERRGDERPWNVLTISARDRDGLRDLATAYATRLREDTGLRMGDVCYTTHVGRDPLKHAFVVAGDSTESLAAGLEKAAAGQKSDNGVATTLLPHKLRKTAWLFTGQGAQYAGMGEALRDEPAYREAIERCAELMDPLLDTPLATLLTSDDGRLDQTAHTQPALFAVEYALARLWLSWGVRPSAVMGHSIGEVVAACVADVLTLEDAVRLVVTRGALMQELPEGGAMVSLSCSEVRAAQAIARVRETVSIAAVNGPEDTVISGKREDVESVARELAGDGVRTKELRVSHAFHSPLMEPMLEPFRASLAELTFSAPRIPLVSNLTGELGKEAGADYWVRHAAGAVRFDDGLRTLHGMGIRTYVEIGPTPILTGLGGRGVEDDTCDWIPSLRPKSDDRLNVLLALGRVHARGHKADWAAFHESEDVRRTALPTTPWKRERFWFREAVAAGVPEGDLPGNLPEPTAGEESEPEESGALSAFRSAVEASPGDPAAGHEVLDGYWRGAISGVLGVNGEEIEPETDVLGFGLDSLMAVELTKGCRAEFGVRVRVSELFAHPAFGEWVELLAAEIRAEHDLGGTTAEMVTEEDSPVNPLWIKKDIELDETIRPSRELKGTWRNPERVLLTGATGFVGAFLLDALLERTDAEVHCLVRAEDEQAGIARLRENMARYMPWREGGDRRVKAVIGDLSRPKLGLSDERFEELADQIDAIYHNGAWVNFNRTYQQLRPTNVGGTQEILRLASTGPLTPISHVSSYAAWGLPEDGRSVIEEDDDIDEAGRLVLGYVQTKWATERLALLAKDRGVPVDVYRLGRVLGDSRSGACLTTHFTTRVIKGCIQMGLAPELDFDIEMTPVDYVAGALTHISTHKDDFGDTYHLVNNVKIPFQELIHFVQSHGWDVELVPTEKWWEVLQEGYGGESEHELHSVMDVVEEFIVGGEEAILYDDTKARSALEGTGIDCPPLDDRLLSLYFDYLVSSGYLPAPEHRKEA